MSDKVMGEKLYYTMGEVTEMTGVKDNILRYWEDELRQLRPKRIRNKRMYQKKDIDLINYIKHLVYEEKLLLPSVKQRLTEERKAAKPTETPTKSVSKSKSKSETKPKAKSEPKKETAVEQETEALQLELLPELVEDNKPSSSSSSSTTSTTTSSSKPAKSKEARERLIAGLEDVLKLLGS